MNSCRKIFNRVGSQVRMMSTEAQKTHSHTPKYEIPKEQKKGFFGRWGSFLYDNRQGVINIFAVYFTLNLAIGYYKSSLEMKDLRAELEDSQTRSRKLSAAFENVQTTNFVDSTVNKIQAAASIDKKRDALRQAIAEALLKEEEVAVDTSVKVDELGSLMQQVLKEEAPASAPKAAKAGRIM